MTCQRTIVTADIILKLDGDEHVQTVPLGRSNLRVSKYSLGTMMFGGKTSRDDSVRITRRAIDAGINFIDTADVYSKGACEEILGEALGGEDNRKLRDSIVLASKGGMVMGPGPNDQGISRFHYVRAVEASLRRLRTDRIDVYYIHWPMAAMNLDETLRTLDDLVSQGKILYPAFSNFPAWLAVRGQWIADVRRYAPLVCGQYPYNLIERGLEVEILPMASALGIGITVYRPLAIGVLTGKYADADASKGARGESDDRPLNWHTKYAAAVKKLVAFAKQHDVTAADVANAWVAAHPSVTSVIVGVSSEKQLEANLAHADFTLTPEQRKEVTGFFPTEIFEEAGGKFPEWRRSFDIAPT